MTRACVLLATAWLFAPALAAAPQLAWKDLDQWIGPEKRIRVETKEKVVLVGVLEEVQPQSLKVDVRYSSDQKRCAKGETIIPYSSISRFAVRKETRKGRKLGMILTLPLAVGAAFFARQSAPSGAAAVAVGILNGAATLGLGYLLGLSADNAWTYVTLEPPPSDASPAQAPAEDVPAEIPGDSLIEIDVIPFI